ncbi:hypothetical protein G6N82_11690 [Altererythrobacter sp. BO-6]|uniref:DUF7064 domain-containing protein n=1 Tax=Altererythrobacter sp. BO-6 TaxID=2604537 RepID=UPI0013E1BF31|nr:hypothetical protein [Altererythrobacter sp. BO-6]QIG54727.1 hypothetical protein G6N82_11690 [Altererythrobacter sp. BO-6]
MMVFESIKSTIPAFDIAHDNRHKLRSEPHSREAIALMLQLPERGIAGFIYPWINADGTAGASISLFGPGLPEAIEERFEAEPVPAEMDFYDWQVAGLTYRIDEPHRSADYRFEGERVKIACRFEAFHPVFPFSAHPDGCPQYYADDRTEQHGWIRGQMEIDGEAFDFETLGQRDHAWGNRIWGLNQHYKWFHATTPTQAVHFFELHSFGAVHLRGFVFRDGAMAQVTRVSHEFHYDEEMHHDVINATVHDDLGRSTLIECERFAKFEFRADPMIALKESAIRVRMGEEEGTGWCEFCWNRNYLDFARQHLAQFQPYPQCSSYRE